MEKWGIIIAAALAVAFIVHSIYHVGSVLGFRLDELHEKVDALQEKLDEIEAEQDRKPYVNPIDL
ncbi:MAG: hypothetical protein ABSG62_00255 [Terracidiphilus sp.]|jgi:hypothetical protein